MKKILVLLLLIPIIFIGCSKIPSYSIKNIEVSSADENIKNWTEKNRKTNGIYLGQAKESDGGVTYYLYINYANLINNKYSSCDAISIDSGEKHNIIINVKPKPSDEKTEKLFYITVKGKPLDKIVLNGEDIKTSSITVVK